MRQIQVLLCLKGEFQANFKFTATARLGLPAADGSFVPPAAASFHTQHVAAIRHFRPMPAMVKAALCTYMLFWTLVSHDNTTLFVDSFSSVGHSTSKKNYIRSSGTFTANLLFLYPITLRLL
jgi:hypothetical protein